MRMIIEVSRDEIQGLVGPFQVVVEMWDKTKFGQVQQAFREEFSSDERKRAKELEILFRHWYLVAGLPEEWRASSKTIDLSRRLIRFFGEV